MQSDLILAIDQGTTGTTVLIMDRQLKQVAEASADFEQFFPQPGWVEHDVELIWKTVLQCLKQALDRGTVDPARIAAIGITNQRETVCFWDRKTLRPLRKAIVWQDRRTSAQCAKLREIPGTESFYQENTGLLLDPYFSGTKVAWALRNDPAVDAAHRAGTLAVGTIDSFLIARLSGASGDGVHLTEPSNASRTLCFHLTRHSFERDLCEPLGVPVELWPEVRPSFGLFAKTRGMGVIPDGIPITGVLGDQQAALLGQACIEVGMTKCTYGTGAFLLMNTGDRPVLSHHRLLSTIAWQQPGGRTTYALEGSAFVAGAAVQWFRDGMKLIQSSAEIETLARSVPSGDGVVFVPALTGLGAPYWDPEATGMFTGLTRGTISGHLARAVLEGIAFQNTDLLFAMEKDLGRPLGQIHVDGGASANGLLMQFQSDILGVNLIRPRNLETTSLGAIFAAGLGAGIWTDLSEIKKSWKEDRVFSPGLSPEGRSQELARWNLAIRRTRVR
jgi:glycerol kinase